MMTGMIAARVCDPQGPRRARLADPAIAIALLILGLFLPLFGAAFLLLGIAFLFGLPLRQARHGCREGSVELGPGWIGVVAGPLSQRISVADIRAASTARTQRGVALAVVRQAPSRPIVLEVGTDEQLDAIRKSLHLGYFGFGEIAWPTRMRGSDKLRSVLATLMTFGWCAMALATACGNGDVFLSLALIVGPASALTLLGTLARGTPAPHVSLTARGVTLVDASGAKIAPYTDIARVDVAATSLILWSEGGTLVIPGEQMLPEEREHLRAQIECAVARAQGQGPPPPGVPPALASLAPRDEPRRAWLERVDAAAAAMGDQGSAYRGTPLSLEDLWLALESPDAPPAVRAAVARVLAQVAPDEASVRIRTVLATERNDGTRARIRVALEEDVDAAAREFERLER
jgi:hypothetical protein